MIRVLLFSHIPSPIRPLVLLALFFTGMVHPSLLSGQSSKDMSLVGSLSYSRELNDIWGYVSPQGIEYALVGLEHGLSIVSLANPTLPVEVQFVPGATSVWRDIKTFGSYAYVSNESSGGVLIVDLSTLPGAVTYKDTVMQGITRAHNLYMDNGLLFVVGSNQFGGGVAIFDLTSDPWNPVFQGAYTTRYVHDVYVRNGLAYNAEISAGRLTVLDLANPTNPQVLGSKAYPDAFTHNTWLNDAGTVCYTTDEYNRAYIRSWDISDPNNIEPLDEIRADLSAGRAAPHNVHVLNDFLITSYYRDGIQIVDARYPYNLIEVGHYDTSPFANGGFNGCWGAYPFLPSGLILASDIEEGLFVLNSQVQRACYLEGKVRDAINSTPLEGVSLEILGTSQEDESEDDGFYAIGIGDSGTYQVAFSKFGYESDTITVSLFNDSLVMADVFLFSLVRAPLEVEVLEAGSLLPIPDAKVVAIAPNGRATFTYVTSGVGKIQDPDFVVSPYELRVGKWGYITRSVDLIMDSVLTQVQVILEKGFYDDFSLDLGWQSLGTAVRGQWERGEPFGTYRFDTDFSIYNPEFDLPFDIGNEAYVTGNAPDSLPFGDDVDRGTAILVSPPMDLSGYNEPVIQFYWWFLNWSIRWNDDKKGNDFLSVSLTDGLDTFELRRFTGPFDTLWNHEDQFYFLKYFDLQARPLQLIFYTQDLEEDNADAVEAAIDGFQVIESPLTRLDPDIPQADFFVDRNTNRLFYQLPPGSPPGSWKVKLLSLTGQDIWQGRMEQASGQMPLPSGLPASIYLISFEFEGKRSSWQKVLLGQ
ncbi:MAG: choice-of-anchor B family protein [Bacteroidota bacterium]